MQHAEHGHLILLVGKSQRECEEQGAKCNVVIVIVEIINGALFSNYFFLFNPFAEYEAHTTLWCTPAIHCGVGVGRSEIEVHLWLCSTFEASLSYMKHCFKIKIKGAGYSEGAASSS